MRYYDERLLAGILAIISFFVIYNVDPLAGTFYTFGVMFYLIPLIAQKKEWIVEFITRRTNLIKSIGVSLLLFGGWVFVSMILYLYVSPVFHRQVESVGFLQVFTELSKDMYYPILSQDPTVQFTIFGVFIPIVETLVFLSFWLKFVAKQIFHLPRIKWYGFGKPQFYKMLWTCAIVGATASLFHMTARSVVEGTGLTQVIITNDFALFVDFLFFTISSLAVFYFQRLFESSNLHVLTNSSVLLIGGI